MGKLDDRLKELREQRDAINLQIDKTRKQLLPINLRRLLKARQRCHPNETYGFTGFLKSAIETPDRVSTTGCYPITDLFEFCNTNDIPLQYDVEGDEYSGPYYKNFRVAFRF